MKEIAVTAAKGDDLPKSYCNIRLRTSSKSIGQFSAVNTVRKNNNSSESSQQLKVGRQTEMPYVTDRYTISNPLKVALGDGAVRCKDQIICASKTGVFKSTRNNCTAIPSTTLVSTTQQCKNKYSKSLIGNNETTCDLFQKCQVPNKFRHNIQEERSLIKSNSLPPIRSTYSRFPSLPICLKRNPSSVPNVFLFPALKVTKTRARDSRNILPLVDSMANVTVRSSTATAKKGLIHAATSNDTYFSSSNNLTTVFNTRKNPRYLNLKSLPIPINNISYNNCGESCSTSLAVLRTVNVKNVMAENDHREKETDKDKRSLEFRKGTTSYFPVKLLLNLLTAGYFILAVKLQKFTKALNLLLFCKHKKCLAIFVLFNLLNSQFQQIPVNSKHSILSSLGILPSLFVGAQDVDEYARNNFGPGSNFRPQYIDGISYTGTTGTGSTDRSRSPAPIEGAVRLRGSSSRYSGNVEVYHLGRWGSICDDDWDLKQATVVCRQLGYPSARRSTHDSEFGRASERFWLDNVNCQGNENFIHQCSSNGWGIHDCSIAEAAGVECVPYPSSRTTSNFRQTSRAPSFTRVFHDSSSSRGSSTSRRPSSSASSSRGNLPNRDDFEPEVSDPFAHLPSRRLSSVIDRSRMRIRLAGGRSNNNEGRIEIDLLGNNRWGVICGDGWMLMEANVTCTKLGLGFAKAAPQTHVYGGRRSDIFINGLTCRGTERDLSECEFKELSTTGRAVQCPGGANIAGVVCGAGLPDLVPDMELLRSTAYIEDRQMFFLRCAMEENCLARSAYALDQNDYMWPYLTRRLLRFTSRIVNLGTADFKPFLPKYLWEWHSCHMHYHSMDVFSHYDVLDRQGRRVAQGHKASFCLEDNECRQYSTNNYRCQNFGDQGISVGCSDVYEHNIDCQWVDITDVPPGFYLFKVMINPEFKVPELSFSNNAIRCDLLYTGLYVTVDNCTLGAP